MELLKHQKELVNEFKEGNSVICNWSRGGGKTFMLAYLILENKPNKVLIKSYAFDPLAKLNEKFEELFKIEPTYKLEISNYKFTKQYIRILFKNNTEIEIVGNDDKDADLVVYDEREPEWDYRKNKSVHNNFISMITKNNANGRLQEFYDCKIIESDIFDLVEEGLYDSTIVRKLLLEPKSFYRERAILSKEEQDTMDFGEFQGKALQKLMKQFLSIPDTKDTVLTRKNIIEMIKDLKQLGLN